MVEDTELREELDELENRYIELQEHRDYFEVQLSDIELEMDGVRNRIYEIETTLGGKA